MIWTSVAPDMAKLVRKGQIWAETLFRVFLQNLILLEIELGFGFNMKVVELFLIFSSTKFQPNPTSRAPDMTKNLKWTHKPTFFDKVHFMPKSFIL